MRSGIQASLASPRGLLSSVVSLALLFSAGLFSTGCSDDPAEPGATVDVDPNSDSIDGIPRVEIVSSDVFHTTDSDPYSIHSAVIEGSQIHITVSTASGCSNEFRLLIGGHFMESYPVQTVAYLLNVDVGDCLPASRHELSYDLQPLIDTYEASYGGSLDPIIIHVFDSHERGDRITVRFEP